MPRSTNDDDKSVRKIAHELWVKRGSPSGSPEEDWFRAEQIVAQQAAPKVARVVPEPVEEPRRVSNGARSRR